MSTGRRRLVVVCAVVALCGVGSARGVPQVSLTEGDISNGSAFATGGSVVVDSFGEAAPTEVGADVEVAIESGGSVPFEFGSGDVAVRPPADYAVAPPDGDYAVVPLEDDVAVWDPAAAFFRSLEPACLAHAAEVGQPPVERERFSGAREVMDIGGGSSLIEDGMGVRLVVLPAAGLVLPDTAGGSDSIPPPYRDACPPGAFGG